MNPEQSHTYYLDNTNAFPCVKFVVSFKFQLICTIWHPVSKVFTLCQLGNKPLPEAMLTQFIDAYMGHQVVSEQTPKGVWADPKVINILWHFHEIQCLVMCFHLDFGLFPASYNHSNSGFGSDLLQWHHNEHDGISNHQPHDCLLNRLFKGQIKETSELHVTGLCAGNSAVAGEFHAQMASNAKNVSMWWRRHV